MNINNLKCCGNCAWYDLEPLCDYHNHIKSSCDCCNKWEPDELTYKERNLSNKILVDKDDQ